MAEQAEPCTHSIVHIVRFYLPIADGVLLDESVYLRNGYRFAVNRM